MYKKILIVNKIIYTTPYPISTKFKRKFSILPWCNLLFLLRSGLTTRNSVHSRDHQPIKSQILVIYIFLFRDPQQIRLPVSEFRNFNHRHIGNKFVFIKLISIIMEYLGSRDRYVESKHDRVNYRKLSSVFNIYNHFRTFIIYY